MEVSHSTYITTLLVLLIPKETKELGFCNFPSFLYAPFPNGDHRTWLTNSQYMRNTDRWAEQQEIIVHETEMVIKHKVHASCNDQSKAKIQSCYHKDVLYTVRCIAEEAGGRFRIQKKTTQNKWVFTCMKFHRINENLVQVYAAAPKDVNEDRLCMDEYLLREEWTWTAPKLHTWEPCSIVGGFDFHAFIPGKSQLCEKVWRPSRIESECIYGEGLFFTFPDEDCSLFFDQTLNQRMQCWGSWDEKNYKFVVLSPEGRPPRYILRLPRDVEILGEFIAHMYFSPVSPITHDGQPDTEGIHYVALNMKRSEPGVCFDESEECREFARQGKCTNSALHKFANYCKRSCSLCDFVPSPQSECRFPIEFQGEWMLFEKDVKESVIIKPGEMTFSHLGHFICKSKHWAMNRYKLLSVYSNGCRPRYTCIHFTQKEETILQFQISRSRQTDESFHMCHFHDDPLPLGSKIRSSIPKSLFLSSQLRWGRCGLGGQVRVNVSLPGGGKRRTCEGTLTDWNMRSCSSTSKLFLRAQRCRFMDTKEFICIAHLRINDDYGLIIIQDEYDQDKFSCWSLRMQPALAFDKPWKTGFLLDHVQCAKDLTWVPQDYQLRISTQGEYLQQGCRESNDNHKPQVSSSSTAHSSTAHNSAVSTSKLETTSKKSAIISPAPNIQNSVDNGGGESGTRRRKEQQTVLGHSVDTSGAESFHFTSEQILHSLIFCATLQLTFTFHLVQWR